MNLASRMMGVGQPDQIMISRTMIDALGDNPKFICRFVGTADFHGKTGTVELYELLAKPLELKQKTKSKMVSDAAPGIAAPDTARKDRLIGGKYFIEKLIGEGAYGKVFKARYADDGKPVAIVGKHWTRSIAQAGEERILLAVTDSAWSTHSNGLSCR